MTVRLLLTASALSLGLATGALAQGMQPGAGGSMQPGMEQGQMGDDAGQAQRPMKRSSKKMKKSMKGKKMMRSKGRMNADPDAGGAPQEGM